jgi:hypothetical protein
MLRRAGRSAASTGGEHLNQWAMRLGDQSAMLTSPNGLAGRMSRHGRANDLAGSPPAHMRLRSGLCHVPVVYADAGAKSRQEVLPGARTHRFGDGVASEVAPARAAVRPRRVGRDLRGLRTSRAK